MVGRARAEGEGRLLEREHPLALLRERVRAAGEGRGGSALILGPAGVGKSALLAALAALGAAAGWLVLEAAAGPLEGELQWSVVRRLFEAVIGAEEAEREGLLAGAAALAAAPLGLAKPGGEAGALHGLYWLTASLAERRPLLLAVDDAHWADGPSRGFLSYLAARVEDLPVVVALAARSGEGEESSLRDLAARPGTEVLTLRDLSPSASAELVREQLEREPAEEFCAACHRASGGNPFLLRELLEELRRRGVEPSAERAEEVAAGTPEAVVRSVGLRLSRMPAANRELAGAVAVLGDSVGLAAAAELAGLDRATAVAAADELAAAAIFRSGSPLGFVHPLLREAVYETLPPYERGERHARAARQLAGAGAGPGEVAAQLVAANPHADPWAVERLREAAGGALAAGSRADAVHLLERALEEPPAPDQRPEVLVELARAAAQAGERTAAERLAAALEVTAEPRDRAALLLDQGRHLYIAGRPAEAAVSFERGIEELGDGEESSLLAELRAGWLTVARIEIPLRERATRMIREITAGREVPSYGQRALLAQVAGQLTFEGAPREEPLQLARLALGDGELAAETSDGMSWIAAMGALGWGDDLDGYERHCEQALAEARGRGSASGFAHASYGISFSHYHRGLLAESIADLQQTIAAERDGWGQFLPAARAQLAWALVERGELAEAEAELARARSDPSWERSSMQGLVLESQARVHLARGEWREALEAALEGGRVFEEALITNPSILPWRARAAIAAARLGEREHAEELLEEGLVRARRFGAPRAIGVLLSAVGLVRGGKAGLETLEEAVAVLAESPSRLEEARATVLCGAAMRRAGSLTGARDLLRRGLDMAAAFGATAMEERAQAELVAAGARPRRRRLSGAGALTPAELRVARLAAGGMSNREIAEALFVSLRTVETHLTRVYRKLDLESRAGLGAALAADEAAPADLRP